jgi:hypothetical protein
MKKMIFMEHLELTRMVFVTDRSSDTKPQQPEGTVRARRRRTSEERRNMYTVKIFRSETNLTLHQLWL